MISPSPYPYSVSGRATLPQSTNRHGLCPPSVRLLHGNQADSSAPIISRSAIVHSWPYLALTPFDVQWHPVRHRASAYTTTATHRNVAPSSVQEYHPLTMRGAAYGYRYVAGHVVIGQPGYRYHSLEGLAVYTPFVPMPLAVPPVPHTLHTILAGETSAHRLEVGAQPQLEIPIVFTPVFTRAQRPRVNIWFGWR